MIRNEWANAHPEISSMFTCKSVTLILQQNIICQILEQENLIHHTMKSIETYFPSIQYQIFEDFL